MKPNLSTQQEFLKTAMENDSEMSHLANKLRVSYMKQAMKIAEHYPQILLDVPGMQGRKASQHFRVNPKMFPESEVFKDASCIRIQKKYLNNSDVYSSGITTGLFTDNTHYEFESFIKKEEDKRAFRFLKSILSENNPLDVGLYTDLNPFVFFTFFGYVDGQSMYEDFKEGLDVLKYCIEVKNYAIVKVQLQNMRVGSDFKTVNFHVKDVKSITDITDKVMSRL